MLRSIQAICLVALSVLLAACGGSGGSNSNEPDNTDQHQPCPTQVNCGAGDELCGRTFNSIALSPKAFVLSTNRVIFRGESEGACAEPHPYASKNSTFNYGTFSYDIIGSGLGLDINGKTELMGAYKADGTAVSLAVKAPGQTGTGLTVMVEKAENLEIHDLLNSTYHCTGILFTGIGEWLALTEELPTTIDPSDIITDWMVSGQLVFGPSNRDIEFTFTGKTLNDDGEIENENFFSVSPESGDVMEVREDGYFKFSLSNELTGAEGFVDQSLNKIILRSDGLSPLLRFMMFCQKEGDVSPVPSGTFLKTFIRRKVVGINSDLSLQYEYSSGVSELIFTGANTLSRRDLNVSDGMLLNDATSFYRQQNKWYDSDGSGFIDEDLDTLIPGNELILRNETLTYMHINDDADEIIERRLPELDTSKLPMDYDFTYEVGIGLGS